MTTPPNSAPPHPPGGTGTTAGPGAPRSPSSASGRQSPSRAQLALADLRRLGVPYRKALEVVEIMEREDHVLFNAGWAWTIMCRHLPTFSSLLDWTQIRGYHEGRT